MPEIPKTQNPDWNANGETQADQDTAREPDREKDAHNPQSEGGVTDGRDRPPADSGHRKSPWLGGG